MTSIMQKSVGKLQKDLAKRSEKIHTAVTQLQKATI